MNLDEYFHFYGFESSGHGWDGSWAEHSKYPTIYSTTEHGYGFGYDYHDYDADMNFGMITSSYGQLEAGYRVWYMGGGLKALGALAMTLRCTNLGYSMTF